MRWSLLTYGLIAASTLGFAAPAEWEDELTLSPSDTADARLFPLVESEGNALADLSLSNATPARPPRNVGIDINPVYQDDASVLEYRTRAGVGFGVSTSAAWSVSQTVPVAKGLDLSIFYLRPMGDVPRAAVRGTGIELPVETPTDSAGMRLEWKF